MPPSPASAGGSEFIYSNELLAGPQGSTFQMPRRNVNRFARRYSVEIVSYEEKMRGAADQIHKNWCKTEGAKYDSIWDESLFMNLFDYHRVIEQFA